MSSGRPGQPLRLARLRTRTSEPTAMAVMCIQAGAVEASAAAVTIEVVPACGW
ncbi:hypothetical protein QMZ92_22840 [Streptomyces sp. HNM0645]|uniref:hypothetical protein n=1 Tax=Streptomyces sp. HNM0645 TaxID=2782343 RepID=UPI0024B845C7|nr:hypothetical protein [Streptomyces sp. HNM0645]MDI9887127.1 hypothetical protein [Streptomyces sp. HNM0645]